LHGKGFQNRKTGIEIKSCFKELLDYYKEVIGIEETESNAIVHHRIALYGAGRPKGKKPIRTKTSKILSRIWVWKRGFHKSRDETINGTEKRII
jgi:hypothetical protein|tara:strand:- start:510 stop:791 length:282 start_codon:yes stop_codon:yes gene_type:complete